MWFISLPMLQTGRKMQCGEMGMKVLVMVVAFLCWHTLPFSRRRERLDPIRRLVCDLIPNPHVMAQKPEASQPPK
jgi:hypothetical protein